MICTKSSAGGKSRGRERTALGGWCRLEKSNWNEEIILARTTISTSLSVPATQIESHGHRVIYCFLVRPRIDRIMASLMQEAVFAILRRFYLEARPSILG